MRAEFQKNEAVPTSGPEFDAMVAGIDEAADMLLHEIIRGNLNEDSGRYGKKKLCVWVVDVRWNLDGLMHLIHYSFIHCFFFYFLILQR
jgi:hypothetical protein